LTRIAILRERGPDETVLREAEAVLRALEPPLELIEADDRTGEAELAATDAILLGPPSAELRARLELDGELRPVRLYDERLCPLKDKRTVDVDLVIFSGRQAGASEAILRTAFEHARKPGRRRRLCLAEDAATRDGAIALTQLAGEFSDVRVQPSTAEMVALEMVSAPEKLDVVVTSGPAGPVLLSVGTALAGGPGLAASVHLRAGRGRAFAPAFRPEAQAFTKGRSNPLGAILAVALLLEQVGLARLAARVDAAVRRAIGEDQTTPDLGGGLSTSEVGSVVRRNL
jgi:3-isopropylmalate dehydrogenase